MNPEFRKIGECKIELVLAMESLINVLKVLKIEHLNESISKSVLPHYKNHSRIPYCHRLDKNLLILKYDDDDVVKASKNKKASLRQNLDVVYCAVDGCNASFCKNDMWHHASWHFIHDPNFMTKSKRDLCGFCAKGKTIHSKTLDTVPGHCSVWNEKGRSFKINANCYNHGLFSLSYKTASKYSRDQPSTNIPIECPLCPGKFYFKYFFKDHWVEIHGNLRLPNNLKSVLEIHSEEKKNIVKFSKTKVNRKRTINSKVKQSEISESKKRKSEENQITTKICNSFLNLTNPFCEKERKKILSYLTNNGSACYQYGNESVAGKNICRLLDDAFITDDIVNLCIALINENMEGVVAQKIVVLNTFFCSRLTGETGILRSGQYLFASVSRESFLKKEIKYHERFNGCKKILVPINLKNLHWIFVCIDLEKMEIIMYDSMICNEEVKVSNESLLMDENKRIITSMIDVEFDKFTEDYLKEICDRNSICNNGAKNVLLLRLYRILFAQEIYFYFRDMADFCEWKIAISDFMPQQSSVGNSCALFMLAGLESLTL